MDQERASDALNTSTGKKLNAKAPEFVPRSAAAVPPLLPPLLHPMYVRPPAFVAPFPPPYYGYANYFLREVSPIYGYNASPVLVGPREYASDGNNGSASASLSHSHHKILKQVEFYFSDINLATTDQLFRFMTNDPEGYVPLSVVASFKKVKTVITDSTELASILRSSNKLLVSEDGKMVRRQHPLTESDMEELQSRIVVAENLPEDHSHQKLMKIFSSVGCVKSIRTCPPQSLTGPSSAFRTGKGDKFQSGGKFHAFVEYASVEEAEKAVAELPDESNWRNGLKLYLLLKSPVKSTLAWTKKVGHDGKKDEATQPEMQDLKEDHLEDSNQHSDAQNHELQALENNAKNMAQKKVRNIKGKGKGQGRPQQPSNGGSAFTYERGSPHPRMPDGTKGFCVGRGKPLAI
ncbi:hypothetical protein ACS0TY_023317 [Phlomoides rotata]